MEILISLLVVFVVTLIIDRVFKDKTWEYWRVHRELYSLYRINFIINFIVIFPLVGIGMCWLLSFL